jgi:hypothetical protein
MGERYLPRLHGPTRSTGIARPSKLPPEVARTVEADALARGPLGDALPRITLRSHLGELGAQLGDQGIGLRVGLIGLGALRHRLGRCLGRE